MSARAAHPTGALYLWDLSASGHANTFYAAAVQAGATSWKAWLFGFNSWSLLIAQALEGVAAVGLLCAAVRRWSGPAAGLSAGAALALTPATALMFRFDHPDALLTLLLVAGAYAVVRAAVSAAQLELASGKAVMAIGGWRGSDHARL